MKKSFKIHNLSDLNFNFFSKSEPLKNFLINWNVISKLKIQNGAYHIIFYLFLVK